MNCTEFRRALQSPGDLSRTDAAAHVRSCGDDECRRAWAETEWLDRAIAAWKSAVPRVDCTDRVLAQWKSDRAGLSSGNPAGNMRPLHTVRSKSRAGKTPAASRSSWMVLASALAVLAAVAVLSSTGTDERVRIADRDSGPAIEEQAPAAPVLDKPLIAEAANPDQGMQDVGLAYVGVAQNATRFMTDFVMLTFGGSEEIEDPSIDQEWIDQWGRQLQPVGEGVDNAVDGILKSFPDSSSI